MQIPTLPLTFKTPSLHSAASLAVIVLPIVLLLGRGASDALMSLIGILFIAHSFLARDFSWLKLRWVQLAIALWLYISLRSIWTDYPSESLARSASWIRFPLFAAALSVWVLREKDVRQWVLYSLCACVLFLLFDGILQFFSGNNLFGKPYIKDNEKIRLTGPFGSPVIGIMLVVLAYPVCMWAMIKENGTTRSFEHFLFGAALCLLLLAVVLISGERTALILCLLGMGLVFVLIPIRLLYKASLIAAGAMVLGLLLFSNPTVMQRQIHSLGATVSDFGNSTYGEIWGSAFRMFQAHPVFGVGVLQFRNECPKSLYGPQETMALRCNFHPHNLYLEWLSETGIIGFGLFVAMISALTLSWVRAYPALKTNPIYLGLLITLCVRFFPFAPLTSFFISWFAIPLWLFIGWLSALSLEAKK